MSQKEVEDLIASFKAEPALAIGSYKKAIEFCDTVLRLYQRLSNGEKSTPVLHELVVAFGNLVEGFDKRIQHRQLLGLRKKCGHIYGMALDDIQTVFYDANLAKVKKDLNIDDVWFGILRM